MGNGLDTGGGAVSATSDKIALRRALLDARRTSPQQSRSDHDAALFDRVIGWVVKVARETRTADGDDCPITIAAHVPVETEPGATSMSPEALRAAVARGSSLPESSIRILLPVCPPGPPTALDWAVFEPGSLVPGKYGLPEPAGERMGPGALADAAAVLVPGVAADGAGMRMGRGAGYYDRSLAHATGRVAVILHPNEIVDAVPHDDHDLPVDAVITADRLMETAGPAHR
ncbi:5-formyltetrahydrofolate cyclo-ligase [uncultured Corynebacterium sp.]|uniref:5-formyltetrahydrofolate cyclo-ligase n=1 Tax=uncultured Corynebacterium sp. TaxID=159447 RepID=UPI0025F4E111|nr:5-formyltetrahydrofolate cyclo-ligase [uncultured Corynebacterium sp.]